ncbi:YheT family hydrolase [Lyngbya confervoides]|uniref:Alpha/beta fold hydrolase n=1 Tax=Lyngbya confervoides BDU141951 TaxID=1574623 RepID=A0ABD4T3U4_9CYAN|nr:alpha/beta fold hydrolase [Lyngbya confervoides]MCM1983249.1 alpha/beta fold hydrolase [Lyngbya confervoides BDU141951]
MYSPPPLLRNGLAMTVHMAWSASWNWESTVRDSEPPYQEQIFRGANEVPLFGWMAIPESPRGTIIATYGITGALENQWYLRVLGRKAFAQGFAVILFDWRAHGKTAELSPTLTSDGLYEGDDFVHIAAQAKRLGCPAPMWFTGYSLGGQLALWGIKAAQSLASWAPDLGLESSEIAGGAVICPNLESNRSFSYLAADGIGRFIEKKIAQSLCQLAWQIHRYHPEDIDPEAIARVDSIHGFDRELVIGRLGFSSVEEYYHATSPLYLLPQIQKPTLVLYAADDPIFDPALVPDIQEVCAQNPAIDLRLTPHGGHVGYQSDRSCQAFWEDSDRWWAWNRILDWCNAPLDPSAI